MSITSGYTTNRIIDMVLPVLAVDDVGTASATQHVVDKQRMAWRRKLASREVVEVVEMVHL